jgi:hypothetical protein
MAADIRCPKCGQLQVPHSICNVCGTTLGDTSGSEAAFSDDPRPPAGNSGAELGGRSGRRFSKAALASFIAALTAWLGFSKELHQVEERYRALYPKVGYSLDLESLGPPPAGRPPSAERAGLIDAELASGRYCHGKILLHYALRRGADGVVAGYTIRAEWAGRSQVRAIDETGALRLATRKD